VLFDGSGDYFVAEDHLELARNLTAARSDPEGEQTSVRRWRASALEGWHVRSSHSDAVRAQQELFEMKNTVSWRITRPLRAVRRRMPTGIKL
jgi:hypothetical protein